MGNGQNKEANLSEALERAIKIVTKYGQIVDGTIVNTDKAETDFVCDVKLGSDGISTFYDVPLKVMVSVQASFIEIPRSGSNCLICFRDGNMGRPQIIFVHDVLKILANCDSFVFNGGQLGGMVKAKELQTQSNKDKDILTALLNIINGAPIMEPGNGAPSAFQAALKGVLGSKSPGTWDNLEDSKILH